MTAEAIEGQIGVTWVNDFVTDWMSRMCLPVMTGAANIDHRRIFEQKDRIACVGLMAGGTFAFRHRQVLGW